jgi:hypothetical protein
MDPSFDALAQIPPAPATNLPESRQVVEIPWGLSPGYAGAELTTAQGSGA